MSMTNYEYGTEESYGILIEAGMPAHPRMRYMAGAATISAAALITGGASQTSVTKSKIHPKDARDMLSMHALRWITSVRDLDGILVLEEMRITDDPIDQYDSDPAVDAQMNIEGSTEVRGKADMLDTIVEAARIFAKHMKGSEA